MSENEKEKLNVYFDPAGRPEVNFDSKQMKLVRETSTYQWRVRFKRPQPATIAGDICTLVLPVHLTARINSPPANALARIKYDMKMRAPTMLIDMGPDYWIGNMLSLAANTAQNWIVKAQLPVPLMAVPFTMENDDIVTGALDFAKDYQLIFPESRENKNSL